MKNRADETGVKKLMTTAKTTIHTITSQQDYRTIVRTAVTTAAEKTATDSRIDIGIPGGRSVSGIVDAIADLPDTVLSRLALQLIDERLSGERNIETVMQAGLQDMVHAGRFQRSHIKTLTTASTNKPQPEPFSLLFIGIGEDGHFASLFPGSYTTLTTDNTLAIVENSPKPPPTRVTITYNGFRRLITKETGIFLIALGEGKRAALEAFLRNEAPNKTPCTFFLRNFTKVDIITDIPLTRPTTEAV